MTGIRGPPGFPGRVDISDLQKGSPGPQGIPGTLGYDGLPGSYSYSNKQTKRKLHYYVFILLYSTM